jgi:integrase
VFCKATGAPPDYHNWRRAFIGLQKRSAIGRIRRVHDIRHTWASQMLLAGKPLAWVSQQLGHRSPAVTLSIYTHWIPGEDHGAKDLLDVSGKRPQQHTSTEWK